MVGLTYFRDDLNPKFAAFFEQAGFKVAAMKGVDVPFSDVGKMPVEQIYAEAKKLFLDSGGGIASTSSGAGIGLSGGDRAFGTGFGHRSIDQCAGRCLGLVQTSRVHEPIEGFGRLLAELP